MDFSNTLINWYLQNKRELPWRQTTDAYKIWLSEVILQQTRVNQGMPYYQRFVEKYPAVEDLANAPEDEVMKLWQGLGYYSRARNMHATAKIVAGKYSGHFPNTFEEILTLKGIGKYTAAAIASIAFNEAVPVVDGNVYRVLARYFGIDTPIDSGQGQKLFFATASQLIDVKQPALFNQALMEFGALHCKPQNPLCATCVFAQTCQALAQNRVQQLPVKSKKTVVKKRYFNYLYIDKPGLTYLNKRGQGDIWANLYEFPLIETLHGIANKKELLENENFRLLVNGQDIQFIKKSFQLVHKLSHRDIEAVFWHIGVDRHFLIKKSYIFETKKDTLPSYGVSRLTERFIEDYINRQP